MTALEEIKFRALGSRCRIVTQGAAGAAAAGRELVQELDALWTRFDSGSEIARLNEHPGQLVFVSARTVDLIARAEQARSWSQHRFNPLMLHHLSELGYDRTWDLGPNASAGGSLCVAPVSHQPIEVFASLSAVQLPAGTQFDPGGIGKGLIADLVAEDLLSRGATCVMVELGGDVRVEGTPWYADQWAVEIAAPQLRDRVAGTMTVERGAIATSSILSRHWNADDGPRHHILDPRTGRPADTDLLTVTITADQTWRAEVAAKAILILGSEGAVDEMHRLGVHGIAYDVTGQLHDSTLASVTGGTTWN